MRGWAKKKLQEQRVSRMRLKRTLAQRAKAKARRKGRSRGRAKDSDQTLRRIAKNPAHPRRYEIALPANLDFDENLEATLNFFSDFRNLLLQERPRSIDLDHSALNRVSPAAALVLIGDIIYGFELLKGCRWRGILPENKEVLELLGEVGYWKYFQGFTWIKSQSNSRQYLQHRSGHRTSGEVVKELVQHFLPELRVPDESKKVLYPAIIECMDNVMKHAYKPADRTKPFYNRWWLLGFRDLQTHEVFFCFYDQGLGIPKTIRVRLKDKLGPLSKSDSALIVKAVVEGHYSSTRDPTRGRGLPTLKRFIDAAKSGELMIVSHKSRCMFSRDRAEELNFANRFGGTLIVWRLQN